MEYVQERVTTLHDLTGPVPDAPTDRTAVVVPMTEREYAGLAAERVLAELERVEPARVVVPLRAPAEKVGRFRDWLTEFDLPIEVLWCDGPRVEEALAEHGLDGSRGKGRDVWLALGRAAAEKFVVVHDADTKTYDRSYVARLLFPLAQGYDFSKGYYARVEDGRLYGRLFRLFYVPLVRTLADAHAAPFLRYLDSFRYALAGEFAATSDVARQIRAPRSWGLEVGTLGDAFDAAGFDGTAQVDLGAYEHDHRAVGGPTGLSDMSRSVGETLLRCVAERGVTPDFATLPARYRETARNLIDQYAADAALNGLQFDRDGEREQVEVYADAVREPGPADDRLPAWAETELDPDAVAERARADLREVAQ
ncbi:glycosyltransferase family protein [Halopelagius longus]|uniref:Glucosyl-3-phosphoglycerate synthase n=1 Tax=Halopelagius longus TaxID=1236180 RepID=A0A1H1D8F6_9EURY|nr:glycosyl transferase family 2 [Halopelagius longus]RDI71222.1 glycosyl transferase family 2 [Halopelagius longus]SDQ72811.1 glucosyl-3-phosphoglycerate synthase [Halopelagius longus]